MKKTIKIGNVELKNNVFLAPMAGITDLPFRLICKKFRQESILLVFYIVLESLLLIEIYTNFVIL